MNPTEEEIESWKTAVYQEKPPEELLKLAHGFLANRYWTSEWHCKSIADVRSTFLIIGLLPKEALGYYVRNKITFFFEDFQKAGPRTVNGMPVFLSCKILNENELNQVREFMKKIKEKDQTILGEITF